jgi:hypothetical protein
MPSDPQDTEKSEIEVPIQQTGDLDFFIGDRIVPVVRELTGDDSSGLPEKQFHFVSAELLEAFSWIHLGAQIGFFPLGPARRVVYEFFPQIFKAYIRLSVLPSFDTLFNSSLRAIWDSEFSGRLALFTTGTLWAEGNLLSPSEGLEFRNASLYATELVRDTDSRPFLQALVFAGKDEWQKAIIKNTPINGVEVFGRDVKAPESQFSEKAHWATAGVLSTTDYLKTIAKLRDWYASGSDSNILALRQRIRDIQQWRLNFGDKGFRDRFEIAARSVARQVKGHERFLGADEHEISKRYVEEIYPLMIFWGAPPVELAASGAT